MGMQLLVVRHAIAEDAGSFARTGKSDDLRPLTDEGREKMREGARGLRELVPSLDLLATSPLVRAVQTAEILSDAYESLSPTVVEALRPETHYRDVLEWLREQHARKIVAVVGHEPHLSGLVSWLLASSSRSFLELKKGAACLLEFEQEVSDGRALLKWSLTPAQLRRLGQD